MTQSIALTNGDLVPANGSLTMVTGLQACMQNCATAMKAMQGEMIYAMTSGVPYRSVVWDNYNPKLFAASARAVLLNVQDVTGIISFSQSMSNGILSYTATIQTVYGVGAI